MSPGQPKLLAFWLFLGVASLTGCRTEPAVSVRSHRLVLIDSNDQPVNPFQGDSAKATVFFFVRTDCPISNRYAPEIQRLAAKYSEHGFAFWLVYPDRDISAREIEQHGKDYHLRLKALRDPRHALVKLARVTVTPEAAVFLGDVREVYHGRIDDRYVDFGKERPAPTRSDLDEALRAIAENKPIVSAVTRAVGCYIE